LGGVRGRLISKEQRIQAILLLEEACQSGARRTEACGILGITVRTLERWGKMDGTQDKRKLVLRVPKNKLTEHEKQEVLAMANSKDYRDLPPSKIVPMLADEGLYLGLCLPKCVNFEDRLYIEIK